MSDENSSFEFDRQLRSSQVPRHCPPYILTIDLRSQAFRTIAKFASILKLFLPRLIQLWNGRPPHQSVHCHATKTGAFCRLCTMLTRRVDSSSSSENKNAINSLSSGQKKAFESDLCGWNAFRGVAPSWAHMDLLCQITFCLCLSRLRMDREYWVS